MSNQAYDKLHKLVAYLILHGILSKALIARILGLSLVDFLAEFDDELKALDRDCEKKD